MGSPLRWPPSLKQVVGSSSQDIPYSKEFPLHLAIFRDEPHTLSRTLQTDGFMLVDQQDRHGNTPLHLAVMLGRKECIILLLAHNAQIKIKNGQGWNCLMEAISYGDRNTISWVLRKLKLQSHQAVTSRKPYLLQVLSSLDDFYMEIKWDFQSWLPLLSRVLPSDVCKIYKRGGALRLDTTLVDFNEKTWERGDVSFIYDARAQRSSEALSILDNKAKIFQRIRYEESERDLDDEVDVLMSSDIVNAQMSTKPIQFQRSISGWIFTHEKTETVCDYSADFYAVGGLFLETQKRREHLTADEVKKNKALVQNLQLGTITEDDWKVPRARKSLPPPPRPLVTWEQYITAAAGSAPPLGRQPVVKRSSKQFKATVAMSEEFPLKISHLLDLLEIVAPFKHLDKLRKFCQFRLPAGFPIRVEIPLFPTISAKVTFQKVVFNHPHLTKKLFQIPRNYHEDSNRFPEL